MTGTCTDVKDAGKRFLGGTDLREQAEGAKLKSIDDFNKAQSAGGAEAAPVLERLRNVLFEVGIDKELFDQVVDGMKKENSESTANESELLAAVSEELGKLETNTSRTKPKQLFRRDSICLSILVLKLCEFHGFLVEYTFCPPSSFSSLFVVCLLFYRLQSYTLLSIIRFLCSLPWLINNVERIETQGRVEGHRCGSTTNKLMLLTGP